jgi:nucleotide-binding universal stress UspA family protein
MQGEDHMQSERAFKKILVPVDGSAPSTAAREMAADFAKKFDSNVTVLYVVSHELMIPNMQKLDDQWNRHEHAYIGARGSAVLPPQVHRSEAPETSAGFEKAAGEITEIYSQEGDHILNDAVNDLKEEGIEAERKLVVRADPSNTILNESENYDIIILGNSGEKEKEPHLGSVAKKVAHRAKIPVLVARGKRDISRILAPIDGSEHSFRMLRYVDMLAAKAKAEVTLLYVQETSIFRLRPSITKEIGNRLLSAATMQLKEVKSEQKLESGDPAKTILKIAKKGDYDIIVIGSRGHSTAEMFMLGSVSDHVVQYADRPVLITK